MLVGTAMTGLDTSPATTLGNAPSMPATTTMTFALWIISRRASIRCKPGHADVVNALDAVAHDFGGDGGFLGHRQIARAGANDGDEPGALRQRLFLDGHAAGERMMDGALEFFAQRAGVFGVMRVTSTRLIVCQKFGGDFDDLLRRLARAKNHFGKTLAQGAMRVHLRKAEVGHRRGLKGLQDFLARNFSGAKLVQ